MSGRAQAHTPGSGRVGVRRHRTAPAALLLVHRFLFLLFLLFTAAPLAHAGAPPLDSAWRTLEPGLELGTLSAPIRSEIGDSLVHVLRIDAARFELRLLNASDPRYGASRTARDWCRQAELVAATNASMYQTDYRTSVSLMRTREHVNNPRLTKDRAVLAFDRTGPSAPPVQIIDRECEDFDRVSKLYGTLVQSIRMISCRGENVWTRQDRKWSTAALGIDKAGKVLLVHVTSPYATHDLIEVLLRLPLDLRNAMYLEGGPEAQLYVGAGGSELEFLGTFETGYRETGETALAIPIPNVLGVVRVPAR